MSGLRKRGFGVIMLLLGLAAVAPGVSVVAGLLLTVPVLKYLETLIHPRWHTRLDPIARLVGIVVVILSAVLVLTPIPLSNIAPALAIAIISLAWLEEDGLLLSIAMLGGLAVLMLMLTLAAVWEIAMGAEWIRRLW